ncbi:glycosyltransferase family A protein [Oceanobacillus halotolerans]|uniref:glycosyltransferase family A protein n=1 Tax=Oceanobacillus halotolerans TaxID=2663380 RepID=UPI001CF7695C|nr:glycosyltransferase family A protein [Oceanobacillus halotolerans]
MTNDWKSDQKLEQELLELDEKLAKAIIERKESEKRLQEIQGAFLHIKSSKVWRLLQSMRKWKGAIRTIIAALLGRRNRKELYSKAYKRKKAANQLKKHLYRLYNLGFTEKALEELETLYKEPPNRYLKQAAAWELMLWYANKNTRDGAEQALAYLPAVVQRENDTDRLRRVAIIEAECYDRLGMPDKGKQILQRQLTQKEHADLYLALANLEETMEKRLEWINKTLRLYNLQPITFGTNDGEITYDDLQTKPMDKKIANGPKVSVILPAYNAEDGIGTAIQSILEQTWRNLELIIVDDCSPDHTVDVVKGYMQRDNRIKLLSTPVNSGPYVARNIALQEATGDFVTINDADDWSHAEKIEIQVKHLMENPDVIANTSEHARLTEEDLKLYRRGTPGNYIFSNMSSLLFRREPVIEQIGYWDNVRFAADSEFKRRLMKVFGAKNVVDLHTGPLSLPRQSVRSLTGSSAFGYNGFLMGVRKEYAEAHRYYHQSAVSLYFPFSQETRLFPVPEPMWPQREEKQAGTRYFDVVLVADFRLKEDVSEIEAALKAQQEEGLRTGLVQLADYKVTTPKEIQPAIRGMLDGYSIQLLVYGETIRCDVVIVMNPKILQEKQQYVPKLQPATVRVVLKEASSISELRRCVNHLEDYVGKRGKWYPANQTIRNTIKEKHGNKLRFSKIASENWVSEDPSLYLKQLADWVVENQRFHKGDGYHQTTQ